MSIELGGSHVNFKRRERKGPLTLDQENYDQAVMYNIREGVTILRKIRTRVLAEDEFSVQQDLLGVSMGLAEIMADFIYSDKKDKLVNPKTHPFVACLKHLGEFFKDQEWETNHMGTLAALPQFSAQNLRNAAEDMLIRTEEVVGSLDKPTHKLNQEEALSVLSQFLLGTNDLHPVNTRDRIFLPNTRHGGILSGGLVYLTLAAQTLREYAQPGIAFDPFAIAVHKANKKALFQVTPDDKQKVKQVYVLDDMVDKGGTVGVARDQIGRHFTLANVWSYFGVSYAGERARKLKLELEAPLWNWFQDYCELDEKGKFEEAAEVFCQAEKYAKDNGIELQPGWYKRKKRMEQKVSKLKPSNNPIVDNQLNSCYFLQS